MLLTCLGSAGFAHAQAAPKISEQRFDCLMNAAERVKLNAEVAGFLRAIYVNRGDKVSSGQIIAQLGSGVEEANLALAKLKAENEANIAASRAKLVLAQRKLARAVALRVTAAVSEKDHDEALADARVAEVTLQDSITNQQIAKAEVVRAEQMLAQRQVRSPIDGLIVERHLAPGEYVHDQAQIVSLVNIDVLYVEVYVPVAYFGQVSLGNVATVFPEQPVGGEYEAAVMIVDRIIDASSGTFGVRLRLPNSDWRLPAGLRCKVKFASAGSVH